MFLTDSEKRVYRIVELEADLPAPEVARRARLKTATVQRILAVGRERGFIAGRTAVIDLSALGRIECGVYVSLQGAHEKRERLIRHLLQRAEVSWVAELGGERDLAFNLIASHSTEIQQSIARLTDEHPEVAASYEVCIRTERMRFPRKELFGAAGSLDGPRFHLGASARTESLDDIDCDILQALAGAQHESFRDLAQQRKIPVATFLRRMKQLKQRRILLGFGYRFNLDILGLQQYRLIISSAHRQSELWQKLIRYSRSHGTIKLLAKTLGRWCAEAEVDVKSPAQLRTLVRDLRSAVGDAEVSIEVIPILEHRKFISFPPALKSR